MNITDKYPLELVKIQNKYCLKIDNLIYENEIISIVKESNNYWREINPFNIISYIELIDNSVIYFNKISIDKYITDNLSITENIYNTSNYYYRYLENKIEKRLNTNVKIYLDQFNNKFFTNCISNFYSYNYHKNIDLFYLTTTNNVINQKTFIYTIKSIICLLGIRYDNYTIKDASKIIFNKIKDKYEGMILLSVLEIFLLGTSNEPLCKIMDENYILETKTFFDISYKYEENLNKIEGYQDNSIQFKDQIYKYGFDNIIKEYENIKKLPENGPYNFKNITYEKITNNDGVLSFCHDLNRIKIKCDYINELKMIDDNNEERINIISQNDINFNLDLYLLKIPLRGELLYNKLMKYGIKISEKFQTEKIFIQFNQWYSLIIKLSILYYKVKKLNKLGFSHNNINQYNILYDFETNHLKLINFEMMTINNYSNDQNSIINIIQHVIYFGINNEIINKLLINNLIISKSTSDFFLKKGDDLVSSLIFLEK